LKFDLAGVRPEDVSIRLLKCGITVSGIRRDWTLEDVAGHYLMEISYNRFERTIELPCQDVEHAQFEMEFRDGILLVRLAL
jgi:HSP20 family molecular chaperone IbpA